MSCGRLRLNHQTSFVTPQFITLPPVLYQLFNKIAHTRDQDITGWPTLLLWCEVVFKWPDLWLIYNEHIPPDYISWNIFSEYKSTQKDLDTYFIVLFIYLLNEKSILSKYCNEWISCLYHNSIQIEYLRYHKSHKNIVQHNVVSISATIKVTSCHFNIQVEPQTSRNVRTIILIIFLRRVIWGLGILSVQRRFLIPRTWNSTDLKFAFGPTHTCSFRTR